MFNKADADLLLEEEPSSFSVNTLKSRLMMMDVGLDLIKRPKSYYVDLYSDSILDPYKRQTLYRNLYAKELSKRESIIEPKVVNYKTRNVLDSRTKIHNQSIHLNKKRIRDLENEIQELKREESLKENENFNRANRLTPVRKDTNSLSIKNSKSGNNFQSSNLNKGGSKSSRNLLEMDDLNLNDRAEKERKNSNNNLQEKIIKDAFQKTSIDLITSRSHSRMTRQSSRKILPNENLDCFKYTNSDFFVISKVMAGTAIIYGCVFYLYKFKNISIDNLDLILRFVSQNNNLIIFSGIGLFLFTIVIVFIVYHQSKTYSDNLKAIAARCYRDTITYLQSQAREGMQTFIEEERLIKLLASNYDIPETKFKQEIYDQYLKPIVLQNHEIKFQEIVEDGNLSTILIYEC